MNWACDLLGVAPDADATAIKRAYARLLRTTRPDEDAAAFQRLNTAYQMALAQAGKLAPRTPQPPPRAPVAHAADDAEAAAHVDAPPMPPAAPQEAPPSAPPALETLTPPAAPRRPAAELPPLEVLQAPAPPPAPVIDVGLLARHVIDAACHAEGPLALSEWLAHCPELWSFRIKQITGQLVLQALAQATRPMQADNFDALLGFFDLNNVLTGLNPITLEQLRYRLEINWERLNDHASLAQRVGMLADGQPQTWRVRAYIDFLKQPQRLGSTIAAALTRGQATHLARIAHVLCNGHVDQLPKEINHKHANFWLRAVEPSGSSLEQLTISLIRTSTLALSCTLILSIFVVIAMGSDITYEWKNFRFIPIFIVVGTIFGWSLFQAICWTDRWQSQPEATLTNPLIRLIFIPATSITTLALGYFGSPPWLSLCVALGTLFLTTRRFDKHTSTYPQKSKTKLTPITISVIFPITIGITSVASKELLGSATIVPLIVTTIATLVVWGIDLWRQRVNG